MSPKSWEDSTKALKEMQRRAVNGLRLHGKTYNRRQAIREEDGMWDPVHREWLLPHEDALLELGAEKCEDGIWRFPPPKGEE